ncbi:MAG: hypothetical protein IT260_05705 [Saprospiraceae bacterium]|nr:hypothetical protein [Saprospiraceae bacterium]
MRILFLFLTIALLSLSILGAACTEKTAATPPPVPGLQTSSEIVQQLPKGADSAKVSFRDLNYWQEKDLFCIIALVDNNADTWQRIWVRVELFDSAGKRLLIGKDSSLIVRAFSDAIPPRGASSIFVTLPYIQLSGTPVSCKLSGAGALLQNPGAILLTGESSGVRMQYPDPKDPKKVIEKAFQSTSMVENPLEMNAPHPRAVMLIYATDNKLYFAQVLDLEKQYEFLRSDKTGPMGPREQRRLVCALVYENLPTPIREKTIGRVDIQMFDARPDAEK